DLQDALRLVDNGNDNPTARAYLRGEAYIIYLMQPNAQGVVPRSSLGLTTNPTGTIDLYAAADSAFNIVETASPECATVIGQWRQQKPWLNTLNGAINALNQNQLDSAELLAKLDGRQPRFVHIDGEHSRAALTRDLELATAVLAPEGVIVLDDIQAADRSTLLLLEVAGAAALDAPLLIIATYRDTEMGDGGILSGTLT
ncbi:MAG: class I SAM-dependent methyltransferase, partial [Gemmatimonadaceae bacterium]